MKDAVIDFLKDVVAAGQPLPQYEYEDETVLHRFARRAVKLLAENQSVCDFGTRPALDAEAGSYHWLYEKRSSDPLIAQWFKGNWSCVGQEGLCSPEEIASRGWRYLGPVNNRLIGDYLDRL